jgi:putative FmdB family regulatory protein
MPLYEYVCDSDGAVIELLRPMADADKPVEDPEGKGRAFRRRHSTFAAAGTASGAGAGASLPVHTHSGTCGCGKPRGSCQN